MRRTVTVLLLAATLLAQDVGGRDPGRGQPPVVFVRWRPSAESKAVFDAAWRALEPFGMLSRRRLVDFDEDPDRAREVIAANADAALFVALDRESAGAVRETMPDTPVLEVSPGELAAVATRVDRARLARLVRRLAPAATKVTVVSPRAEKLPRFETGPGGDLVWVAEGGQLERAPEAAVVSTSPRLAEGLATLTVRPDPRSVGWRVAALVVKKIRDDAPFERAEVARLFVTVDLRAAQAAGYRVPLGMLARADAVRGTR
jgi:hypothetical protein